MYLLNGEKFNPYIQHAIGETQYPPRWFLDADERAKVGIVDAVEIPIPTIDPITHQVKEAPFAQVDGVWTQQWEVIALDAETVAANQARSVISSISKLEAQQTPRRIREAALTQAGADWLAGIEAQIVALRAQL